MHPLFRLSVRLPLRLRGGVRYAKPLSRGPHMGETFQAPNHFYCFGSFVLDAPRLLLSDGGEPVPLAPRFVRTLLLLVQNHGLALNKQYLMDQLWPDTAVEENNLTVIISALRKVL